MLEDGRCPEVVFEAAGAVHLVDVFAETIDPLANIANALAADFHQLDIVLGEDAGGARRPGECGDFTEQAAGPALDRAVPVENGLQVADKRMGPLATAAHPGVTSAPVAGGVPHLGQPRVLPKLAEGVEKAFFRYRRPAEKRIGKFGRRQDHADVSRNEEKRGGPVITRADDDVALIVTQNPGIVADDVPERQRLRKLGRVHVTEHFQVHDPVHVGVGHVRDKRVVPALRPIDHYPAWHGLLTVRLRGDGLS